MSVEAFSWALNVPVGGNLKVVLLGIANHANPYGADAFPSYDTLARYAHCDRKTAKRNVLKLAEAGWIVRDGEGPNGTIRWRVAMGGQNAPGAPEAVGGGIRYPPGGTPVPPEPSLGTVSKPSTGRTRADAWPDDLPERLHDVAMQAGRILKATALARGQQREVTRAAVGQTVASFPDRDHVQVARDVEFYLLHGKGAAMSCRDVVARYRQFLKTSEPVAAPPLRVANGAAGNRNGRDIVPGTYSAVAARRRGQA